MFNEILFANRTAAEVTSKFTHVCQSLADLRHPNIVQFLGVCFVQDQALPVIVTEKLEGSLHSLLATVANIPMTLKQSLLEDVARGLHYLHTSNPSITHGALTARNVLYTSSLVAKVSDVCNSQLVQLQSRQLVQALTLETLSYMPKDAVTQSSPKTDVFSFGHLALFTLTQVSVLMTNSRLSDILNLVSWQSSIRISSRVAILVLLLGTPRWLKPTSIRIANHPWPTIY